jgi:hypothetical protein
MRIDPSGESWSNPFQKIVSGISQIISKGVDALQPESGTRFVGADFSAQCGYRVNITAGLVGDSQGNIGILASVGGGASTNLGASYGATYARTIAPTIYDLNGLGVDAGIGGSIPDTTIGGSIDFTTNANRYHGVAATVGYDASIAPVDFHLQMSGTKVWSLKNIFDFFF